MGSKKTLAVGVLAGLGCAVMAFMPVAPAGAREAPIQAYDRDNDGTLDLAEVKEPASKTFDRLDRDHEGTLDRKELGSRISKKDFEKADVDHDGALTKDEYLALVEQLFKKADTNGDGTLDTKELRVTAHPLLELGCNKLLT